MSEQEAKTSSDRATKNSQKAGKSGNPTENPEPKRRTEKRTTTSKNIEGDDPEWENLSEEHEDEKVTSSDILEELQELGSPLLLLEYDVKECEGFFAASAPVENFPKEISDLLHERRIIALKFGEQRLIRVLTKNLDSHLSRKQRKKYQEELKSLDVVLTQVRESTDNITGTQGFAIRRHNLSRLMGQLKSRRDQAQDSLLIQTIAIPGFPIWGPTGQANEFWNANDFEILCTCFRKEVEDFLLILANSLEASLPQHFTPEAPALKTTRVSSPQPNISAYMQMQNRSRTWASTRPGVSAFGRPTDHTSSKRLRQLFGDEATKSPAGNRLPGNPTRGNSSHSRGSHFQYDTPPHLQSGHPDPDPSDSEDEDDNSNSSRKGLPRVPNRNSNRPARQEKSQEIADISATQTEIQPQFDSKLKVDIIPTWDGTADDLGRWISKINRLSERSEMVFKQLGSLVPTRLTGSAETWYYSQGPEIRYEIEQNWDTLREAIGAYYMNRSFMDKQKSRANKAHYRERGHTNETPSEYYIRKNDLLEFVYDYMDVEMINEIMNGAPSYWASILTPHLHLTLRDFQLAIKYHEDNLMRLDPYRTQFNAPKYDSSLPSRENPNSRNPFNQYRNAKTNLVGWSKSTSTPQFPKDDTNISPRGTPEEKGARPCRHCGSSKHWDRDCKYARKGERNARVNAVLSTAEDHEALDEYESLYYDMASDSENEQEVQKDFS
ncbi:hypothetical protein BDQ12DRAFT_765496 [Crucibulum laeve]|uniref:Uncharacterized protein n=1 Tax=Crucibulum laeve TaxID=68775 RepID=A0A5C3LM35_9AGAR|nr:hypothetical protein BDQ12DRAFT_765496 [Crucibulum laeve]